MVFKLLGKWWWPSDLAEVAFIIAFAVAFLTVVIFNYAVGITLVLVFVALLWAMKNDYIRASWFVPKSWRGRGPNVPIILAYVISLAIAVYYFWPAVISVLLIPVNVVLDDMGNQTPKYGISRWLDKVTGLGKFTPKNQDLYDKDHGYGKYRRKDDFY